MKVNLLKITGVFTLAILLFTSCNQSTKVKETKGITTTGLEASVEIEVFDAMKIKDQLLDVMNKTSRYGEIADFINKVGASYIIDLTIPIDDAEKFMTKTQMSIGMGMYTFDGQYAKVYNRYDNLARTSEISKQFVVKLGLQNELTSSQNYVGRIKENIDNKDSVDYLVTEMMNFVYQQYQITEEPSIYALSYVGGNIEALYILSQLSLFAQNNQPMIDFLSQQGERAKSVFMVLEMMSEDINVKPYYEKMKVIAKYFEEHKTFTEKELKEVSPLIEKFRNDIIN